MSKKKKKEQCVLKTYFEMKCGDSLEGLLRESESLEEVIGVTQIGGWRWSIQWRVIGGGHRTLESCQSGLEARESLYQLTGKDCRKCRVAGGMEGVV